MTRWMAMALVGCGQIGFDRIDVGDKDDAGMPGDVVDDVPGAPGWVLVQTKAAEGASLTVDRFGPGHLIIVAAQLDNDGMITDIADSSHCNTYEPITDAHARCDGAGSELQIFYVKSSCAGAEAINVTATDAVFAFAAWEVSGLRTDEPLDTASALQDEPASDTPQGPNIATSTDGEFVVSVAIAEQEITRIHAGDAFTNDHDVAGNGWAHLTDPMARAGDYHAQWDQSPAAPYCANAAAFKVAP
jgi:hypothetical protein